MNNVEQIITRDETNMINRIANDVHRKYGFSSTRQEFISRTELYHCGIQGLLEAKKRFKGEFNIPWLAFASYRVRGNMLDNVRKLPFIKLSYEQCKKIKIIEKTRRYLLKMNGTVSTDQIAQELDWPESSVCHLLEQKINAQTLSISHKYSSDKYQPEGGLAIIDLLEDTSLDPAKQLAKEEVAELLQICLANLQKKDAFILLCRIVKGHKLREVAYSLDCSEENIRRRQSKAQKQMEKCITNKGWSLNMCIEVIT